MNDTDWRRLVPAEALAAGNALFTEEIEVRRQARLRLARQTADASGAA